MEIKLIFEIDSFDAIGDNSTSKFMAEQTYDSELCVADRHFHSFIGVVVNSSEMTELKMCHRDNCLYTTKIAYLCLPSCRRDIRRSLACVRSVNRSVCFRIGLSSFSEICFACSTFAMYLSIKSGQFKCSSGSHESYSER